MRKSPPRSSEAMPVSIVAKVHPSAPSHELKNVRGACAALLEETVQSG